MSTLWTWKLYFSCVQVKFSGKTFVAASVMSDWNIARKTGDREL